MMADRVKVPAAFWLGVDRLNLRRSELLRKAGLPLQAGQENTHLDTAQFFALWRGLDALGGTDVGLHLSQSLDGAVMPPSFMAGYHARDLHDALQRVARFKRLCAPEQLDITLTADACILSPTWPYGKGEAPRSLTDATMGSLLALARAGTGRNVRPLRLELQRGPSAAISTFFRCPIGWNAERDRLILTRSDLLLPFETYNRELLDLLDRALSSDIGRQEKSGTLVDRVRWLLRRNLTAGRPELRSIARELALSERSLQRRLSEEGQSFQSLLSGTRHALAREYLEESALDIIEVASLLGYDEQGSFYRAFQKWEGCTPSEWRIGHSRRTA
ncbi:AraC family transcriptional regulator ligand-binding domain-containing protein [Fulvimarina sp. 2208YS6-2-32]|uniref:AraC family transcriptional regulator ligand-binding domain-containing protein n=1 Tax=Fulvimarina uroteuthidis TaxID=3098149 RepID=A0ABU5I1K3_9HYPH|nr:AraC family transcriptional regulator ligand-binding domain-containing protein [Fulvimarina sp. 2208YS6-2-32]MDY8109261.1 AraC family transcriptional regulator ligand-binding domain-containing protein [Fulvimarina sp. 2208YS6-2-32]